MRLSTKIAKGSSDCKTETVVLWNPEIQTIAKKTTSRGASPISMILAVLSPGESASESKQG